MTERECARRLPPLLARALARTGPVAGIGAGAPSTDQSTASLPTGGAVQVDDAGPDPGARADHPPPRGLSGRHPH